MTAQSHVCLTGFLITLLTVFTATAVVGQDIKTTVNPHQDFSKFSKYSWRQNRIAPGVAPEERDAIEAKIKGVVNQELSKRGYVEDRQNPDFFIEIGAAALPGEMLTSANRDLRVPDSVTVYDSQSPGGPGVTTWLAVTAGARIIVTDSVSNTTAWEALVTKKYKNPDKYRQKERLETEIESFFRKGIRDFPSKKGK